MNALKTCSNTRPNELSFNKSSYDPFIDFLKAYCILVVVFCHGFPYLNQIGYPIWGVQIPLFLLIQVFHCYKRPSKPLNWRVIISRIIVPFVIIEAIIFGFYSVNYLENEYNILNINGIIGGGYGPGSYYPWIYLQMAILLPMFRPLCERLTSKQLLAGFALLSITIETVCSLIHLPDYIYRLLCVRYLFLIPLGWIWAKGHILISRTIGVISLLSLGSIVFFGYSNCNLEPIFFNTGWKTHRWPCYIFTSFLFTAIMYRIYLYIVRCNLVVRVNKVLSTASYEIFLVQMAYYAVVKQEWFVYITCIELIQFVLWFLTAFIVSILGGMTLRYIQKTHFAATINHFVKSTNKNLN